MAAAQSDYNVFILNNIENNAKDVERLMRTFSALNCKIRVVKNSSYNELIKLVDSIMTADFSRFNYIVIVILDNQNNHENMWTTTDGKIFRLYTHFINEIARNKSLKGKLRISIHQNNRHHDGDMPKTIQPIENLIYYPGKDVKFYATTSGCLLNHTWDNDNESDFIRILCDAIDQNMTTNYPIKYLLDRVSDEVGNKTNDMPSKEINFTEDCVLGNALARI